MNASLHDQLHPVRVKLFGPCPKQKRVRRVRFAPVPIVPNNFPHVVVHSVTVSLPF